MLPGNLKGVSRKFKGCFEEVLKVLKESFKGVSRDPVFEVQR